jgi:L-ascorbate metabolism protein UlaG (beta-lactamase superfamily)
VAGAERIGGRAIGMEPWSAHDVVAAGDRILGITATPARHGPAGGDRGPVIGFVLAFADARGPVVYVTGDSVWFDGIEEVARRFAPDVVILFAGAARVREVGPAHLTFTAEEAVAVARAFPRALIVPAHYEGWAHFSEGRDDLERAFAAAHLEHRLRWPAAGRAIDLAFDR